ncbi:MAG: DUF2094 domain-containing protein [Acidobacteria bacterium]|nr:DUF2094 domain-containing protein [Acidobacteriota bacterium]
MQAGGLRIGCFGKIRSARDYVRLNASLPTAAALVAWIEQGRQDMLERTDASHGAFGNETARRRIAFGLPGSSELLAGVIRPSTDEGGLREFPFAAFTCFPRRAFARGYYLLPLALGRVWDVLDDAWDALTGAAGPAAFRELADGLLCPAPDDPDALATRYRASLQDEVGWAGSVELTRPFGAQGPVSAPVSRDLEQACFDATFWIDYLDKLRDARGREPAVFIDSTPNCAVRLADFAAGLRPEDYGYLMGCSATEPPPVASPAAPPRPTFAQLLGSGR